MSTTIKYPSFDLLEVEPNDFPYKKYEPLKPAKAGNFISEFNLDFAYSRWQNFYNGAPAYGPIATRQLFGKPLVISFYSKKWKNRGLDHLKQLNTLQSEIRANGGNLVVISAEEADEELAQIMWENNLSLTFYHDRGNKVAEEFKVFSEKDPIWNRFGGINENVPFLATYVVNTVKQVVFDYVDYNLTGSINSDVLLSAIYTSAIENEMRWSA